MESLERPTKRGSFQPGLAATAVGVAPTASIAAENNNTTFPGEK